MVVMIIVASLGYLVSYFVGKGLPDQTDVQSAVAAFAIGIAGNIYSRLAGGSAFPSMVSVGGFRFSYTCQGAWTTANL